MKRKMWCSIKMLSIMGLCLVTASMSYGQVGMFNANIDIDNGRLGAAGSTEYDPLTDTYTVKGSGDDVWNEADAFQFAYVEWSGDFTFIADVSIDGGNPDQAWIKSMLMARQDTSPGSANVTTRVRRDGQFSMQWRPVADQGGASTPGDQRVTGKNPARQRLDRVGDTFICSFLDENGVWVEVDREDVVLNDPILVGIGVTAHDTGEIATGTFGNVVLGAPIDGPMDYHLDIGRPEKLGAAGSASFADGVYTINGSGDDVWNEEDAFHFVYKEWSGDFDVAADVSIDGGNPDQAWIKSMIMARQSLTPGSVNITTRVRRDGQYSTQQRPDYQQGGSSTPGDLRVTGKNPGRHRFVKEGSTFSTYFLEGNDWVMVDSQELELQDPYFLGFGVTAHDTGEIATGTFGNIVIKGGPMASSAENWELLQ